MDKECEKIICSAPGSLMLMGEYAVLEYGQALAAAIDQRIYVDLVRRDDFYIHLESDKFDSLIFSYQNIPQNSTWKFVLAAIDSMSDLLPGGCTIKIKSDFSSTMGLGSSAAVVVAVIGALLKFCRVPVDDYREEIYKRSYQIIKSVQGLASGTDVAASIYGGVVHYKLNPFSVHKILDNLDLVVLFSGYKRATPELIFEFMDRKNKFSQLYSNILSAINECVSLAAAAIAKSDLKLLGQIINIHQGLLDSIAVNDGKLSQLIYELRQEPQILGSKISGSGLGDCVIGLGKLSSAHPQQLLVKVNEKGFEYAE